MMRWSLLIVTVALATCVIALPPSAIGRPASDARTLDNSVTFPDSTGEDAAAPDITSVVVSNDNSGLITFQINVSNRPALTADMLVEIYIDADQNPSTGDPFGGATEAGADYVIQFVPGHVGMFQWTGSTYINAPLQSTLISSYAATGPTIRINASDLGNTKGFNFFTDIVSGIAVDASGVPDFTNAHADIAPDFGHGLWNYQIKIAPPPPPPPPPPPLPPPPAKPKFVVTPAGVPHAGKRFQVAVVVDVGGVPGAPNSLVCTAKVGAAPVKTAVQKNPAGAGKACALTVPKGAKGKTLGMNLKMAYKSTSAARALSFKIS